MPSTTGGNGRCSRCPTAANGATARSHCWATPSTPCCRLPRKARPRHWRDRGCRGARQTASAKPGENTAGIPARAETLWTAGAARGVRRIQARGAGANGRIYHLTGPAAYARDLVIKAIGGKADAGRGRTGSTTGGRGEGSAMREASVYKNVVPAKGRDPYAGGGALRAGPRRPL